LIVTKPAAAPLRYKYDSAKAFPRAGTARPAGSREPEPLAVEARAKAIDRDADLIAAECEAAAAGDWVKWEANTDRYREQLRAKTDALKKSNRYQGSYDLIEYEPLEGIDGFPLFEIDAKRKLRYLCDSSSLDGFRRDLPVLALHRWLKKRGIDLIFVPVPKMAEVYIEHFVDPCPRDGIIAPHIRKVLLDLLRSGVEVVDGFPRFHLLRKPDPDYLYNSADTHWSPRAMRILAKEVAERIGRYGFGSSARYALPIVKTDIGPYVIHVSAGIMYDGSPVQNGWLALNSTQQKRAATVQTRTNTQVTTLDDQVPPDDPASPVLLIGHSYVLNFRELLIRECNLLVSTLASDNQTTEFCADFLRQPELLKHCRVVVWITTEHHLTQLKQLPPAFAK
jgi:hypothetical protein